MAQLKVGDIKISDGQIHIGPTEFISGAPQPPRDREPPQRDQLPATLMGIKGTTLIFTGVGVAALGGGLFATLSYLGGLLVPMGVGLAVLGGLKLKLDARASEQKQLGAEAQHEAHAAPMLAAIEASDGQRSLEELARAAGLPLEDAIRGLAHLQKAGRVEEKLNLDTGDWYYAATPAQQPAYASGSLAERMAALEEEQ